jgi:cytidine deaminase
MNSEISSASVKVRDLFKAALLAREKAHAPYSGCKVGAAVRTSTGQIFSGCNVENSSYGASNCAERVAIQKAVSEVENLKIIEVMVVTDANPPWPPCGLCRQVMIEFGQEVTVYSAGLQGALTEATLTELLPNAFTPANLKK